MNSSAAQPPGDWGEISDAELINLRSEYLDTAPPQPPPESEVSEKVDDTWKKADQRVAAVVPGFSRSPQKRKRPGLGRNPLERFRLRHLSVTQVCEQAWCELQVAYRFEVPYVPRKQEWSSEVKAGTSIHLTRELEVHNVVPVPVVSREDRHAITFLNLLSEIPTLRAGDRVRELPVFGVLEGVFFLGVVDELCYSEKGELVLNELKTRGHNSMPGRAQFKGHCLQVGLYKLLFDSLVRGELTREHVITHLGLRPQQALGAAVLEHAGKLDLQVSTFGDLLDLVLLNLKYCEVPSIDVLRLEYIHQGSGSLIGYKDVSFSEPLLRAKLRYFLSYWTGHREPRGVDIEDTWKCASCSYKEHCEWKVEGPKDAVTTPTNSVTTSTNKTFTNHTHQQDTVTTLITPTYMTVTDCTQQPDTLASDHTHTPDTLISDYTPTPDIPTGDHTHQLSDQINQQHTVSIQTTPTNDMLSTVTTPTNKALA